MNIREDAIYGRQSVDRKDSISIESQIEFCKYELRGGNFRQHTDKGYSGKNTDRPKFQELMADIKRGLIKRVAKLVLMGGGTGGMSLFTPMPTEGIKLLNALYREPTIENLKKMMSIFVFDTRDLTEALFEARLNNMLSRRDHLDNFVKSLEANPKQFPDFGPRLGEISAPTLIVWGRNDRFVPMDAGLRLLAGIAGS